VGSVCHSHPKGPVASLWRGGALIFYASHGSGQGVHVSDMYLNGLPWLKLPAVADRPGYYPAEVLLVVSQLSFDHLNKSVTVMAPNCWCRDLSRKCRVQSCGKQRRGYEQFLGH